MCKRQKINRGSDDHAIKVVETQRTDCATHIEKRKSEKKIQRNRDRIRVFNEKPLLFAERPLSRIRDPQFNNELIKNQVDDTKLKITKQQNQSSPKTVIL